MPSVHVKATPASRGITIAFNRGELDRDTLHSLHRELLLPRLIEEKMLLLLRQGKISKWSSGIGEEAIRSLDAPIRRLGSLETPVPFNPEHESQFLPKKGLKETIAQLIAY